MHVADLVIEVCNPKLPWFSLTAQVIGKRKGGEGVFFSQVIMISSTFLCSNARHFVVRNSEQVSSFSTVARKSGRNFNNLFKKPRGCDADDYMRWKNCVQRDFTINGLCT